MKIKLLGITIDMELEELVNPDVAKKYEDGINATLAVMQETPAPDSAGSEDIRRRCQSVIDLFTGMFGDKAAREVLGERTNLIRCMDAFDELLMLYPKQVTPMIEKRRERYSRARLDGR